MVEREKREIEKGSRERIEIERNLKLLPESIPQVSLGM